MTLLPLQRNRPPLRSSRTDASPTTYSRRQRAPAGVLLICETWRDEAALAAHSASEPFVKNVAIINDCGEMKIEKFEM